MLEKEIVLLINGIIKILSLTCHQLTGMDGVLGPAPGSRTFDNEWQLLPAHLVVMGPPAKAWLPLLSLLPEPFIGSEHFGLTFVIRHLASQNLTESAVLLCSHRFTGSCCSNCLKITSGNLTRENALSPQITFVANYMSPLCIFY